ncbi:MAG: phenylalanine--tRNA ligase subunit alpha [Acidobacteriota bacterium]|nr:phenylalanine--tRNA ligase subunit alpha [Acidobacteriota bacterium]
MYQVPKLADYSPQSLDAAVRDLLAALETEAAAVASEADHKAFRDRWMARKNGILAQINDLWLKAASGEAKREVGRRVNELNKEVEELVESARARATGSASSARIDAEKLDVTLPGIRRPLGVEHPVIRTMNTIVHVFQAMGYSVGEGPEIETDYYNFEALNFPPNHPARDTQDTIFIAGQEKKPQRDRLLLRTHTSPVQIHTMERQPPPVRIVIPGKVYRHDTPDATHSPVFHQVEGLVVDTNITFRDLKGTLDHAMKALFGSAAKTRFFPSFFPFTEPSADVAVTCFKCGGRGLINGTPCRLCKMSGWIELLGSGMVDPNVFEFVKKNGYDPAKVSGFAFGMGVERIAMAMYGIDDIQLLYSGDVRFLEQFA